MDIQTPSGVSGPGARVMFSRSKCFVCSSDVKPLFRIPEESHRMREWLLCLQKEHLLDSLSERYIYLNARLCNIHFADTAFSSTLRNRLIRFARPIDLRPISNAHIEESPSVVEESPSVVEESPSVVEESPSVVEESPSVVEEVGPVHSETPILSQPSSTSRSFQLTPKSSEIRRLRTGVTKLKKKLFKVKNSVKMQLQDKLTARQYEFVQSQLRNGKTSATGRRWTAKEKAFALDIFMQSSSAYNILRRSLILPCPKTLRNCTNKIAKDDGFCPILFEALKKKVQQLSEEEKICTLVFDEMSIKSQLRYNPTLDRVDGYESGSTENPKVATQALCFMLRGVMKNWKQVIAYYFRGNTCSQGWLEEKVFHIIRQVLSCGLTPIAIVCDQGPQNQALFKSLGVSVDRPYFHVDDVKVFGLYDVPHLIKSVRNNLKKYDCHFNSLKYNVGRTASWKDISELYIADSKEKYRLVPKLTDAHINAEGLASMKVSLATQVFSRSVAAGLCFFHKIRPDTKALETASFVNKMDKIFDSMNSKSVYSSKQYARAVSKDSLHVAKWEKWCKWIDTWKFVNAEKKVIRTPCKQGLMLTLKATVEIWRTLEDKMSYLLTSRLNQDCIENTFSSVRRRGGFRDNPSTMDFRSAIRNVIVHNFMKKSKFKNCEDDGDYNLIDFNNEAPNVLTAFYEDDDENELVMDLDRGEVPTISEIDQNVIAYISGVISRALLKKSSCDDCRNLLVGDKALDNHTLLLYFKEYKEATHGLNWPTGSYHDYIIKLSEIYFQHIKTFFNKPNLKQNLYSVLGKAELDFSDHHHKDDVKHFIIKYFINMMIRHSVKVENSERPVKKKTKKRKLNHVQNV